AERAALETEILDEPGALTELAAQQSVDAGLRALLDPRAERLEAAIMRSIRSASVETTVEQVLADTVLARRRSPVDLFLWLRGAFQRPAFWAAAAGVAAIVAAATWLAVK